MNFSSRSFPFQKVHILSFSLLYLIYFCCYDAVAMQNSERDFSPLTISDAKHFTKIQLK